MKTQCFTLISTRNLPPSHGTAAKVDDFHCNPRRIALLLPSCVSAICYQRNTSNYWIQLSCLCPVILITRETLLHDNRTTLPAFVTALDLVWTQPNTLVGEAGCSGQGTWGKCCSNWLYSQGHSSFNTIWPLQSIQQDQHLQVYTLQIVFKVNLQGTAGNILSSSYSTNPFCNAPSSLCGPLSSDDLG